MTQDETVALWGKCEAARKEALDAALAEGRDKGDADDLGHEAARVVWNAWADDVLTQRKAIDQAGGWSTARDGRGELQPRNDATQAWFRAAAADFSRLQFSRSAGLQPPANLIVVAGDRARFSGFVFPGPASFREAGFGMTAWFENAVFLGSASFEEANFASDAWFEHVQFSEAAWFDEAAFAGDGWFENAVFSGNASFLQANFRGCTTFLEARFALGANFTAISGERAFQLGGARFETEPPSFVQADFKKAPRFDDVHVPLPGYFARGDRERAARYRTLRQFADAGLDHERERTFFKGEVRSRRWVEDKPWRAAFWLGLAYDAFSDFGTSIMQPIMLWFVSLFVAASFYLKAAGVTPDAAGACTARNGDPAVQALFLSMKNALVVLGNYRDHRVTQAYHCLFGGPADAPDIPLTVTIGEAAHTLWSAILIFLLLLAVRNQFRIR